MKRRSTPAQLQALDKARRMQTAGHNSGDKVALQATHAARQATKAAESATRKGTDSLSREIANAKHNYAASLHFKASTLHKSFGNAGAASHHELQAHRHINKALDLNVDNH